MRSPHAEHRLELAAALRAARFDPFRLDRAKLRFSLGVSAADLRVPFHVSSELSQLVLQAAVALFAGPLDEGERLAEEAIALNRRHGDDAEQEHTVQRLALALERRDPPAVPIAALRDNAQPYLGRPASVRNTSRHSTLDEMALT